MGCLLGLLGLITPRVVLVLLWVFTNYLSRAFHTFVWPFLGFIFLPTTTLAYAVAHELGLGPVLRWPITSRSTLKEGLYEYDAVGRLYDAGLRNAGVLARQGGESAEPPGIGEST